MVKYVFAYPCYKLNEAGRAIGRPLIIDVNYVIDFDTCFRVKYRIQMNATLYGMYVEYIIQIHSAYHDDKIL